MEKLTKAQLEAIDNVMDWFDFQEVHSVMTFLGWGWGTQNVVPSVPELRHCARSIMQRLKDGTMEGTGGFYAQREGDEYSLQFVLTEWHSGE